LNGFDRPSLFSYLLGSIDFHHISQRSALSVSYTGGGTLSTYQNSAVQQLQISEQIQGRRWSLLFADNASFLSQSPFELGGIGALAFVNNVPGLDLQQLSPFLNVSLIPNQTVPTFMVPRLSNVAAAQVTYDLSPRSSWTASASYGTLHFFGGNYIDSTNPAFQAGYNYLLSPASSIAVVYRFNLFRFTHFPQRLEDHVAEIVYGRYLTGRMSLQIGAGPSFTQLRGLLTGNSQRPSWALNASLNYRLDRTRMLLRYDHLVTGGSGVFVGAQTSQVEAAIEHELNRQWTSLVSLGYAANRDLVPVTSDLGKGPSNSWYAGAQFTRKLRPGTTLFFGYSAHLQVTQRDPCPGPPCGRKFIGQDVSAGINFSLRPVSLN